MSRKGDFMTQGGSSSSTIPPDTQQVDLNKAVFDYGRKLSDDVVKQIELLEAKSNFCLAVLTVLVGGLFLNLEMYPKLYRAIVHQNIMLQFLMYAELALLAFSTPAAFVFVLRAMRIRKWRLETTSTTVSDLLGTNDLCALYRNLATRYLLAWEHNFLIINQKSKCTSGATSLLFVAILALFSLILTFAPILAHGG
jgi:hypothetical protein